MQFCYSLKRTHAIRVSEIYGSTDEDQITEVVTIKAAESSAIVAIAKRATTTAALSKKLTKCSLKSINIY